MLQKVAEGIYTLIESKQHIKLLMLNKKHIYAWIYAGEIGEILVSTHKPHSTDSLLSTGKYRIYSVKNENAFTDLLHLELYVGGGSWQGYLLPNGLPEGDKIRSKIIPTKELITRGV